jgi:excisionase family DNA binding protein
MGKARAEFSVEERLSALPRNADSETTAETLGRIPSWASKTLDLNEPSEPARFDAAGAVRARPTSVASLMTVAEAATALRVSTKTIRRMLNRGELRRVKVGRLVRIREDDIGQIIGDHSNV